MVAVSSMERDMAKPKRKVGRPVTSTRDDVVAKIDRMVVARAKFVAESRKIPLAEYLTESLRPIVNRDFDRVAKEGGEG